MATANKIHYTYTSSAYPDAHYDDMRKAGDTMLTFEHAEWANTRTYECNTPEARQAFADEWFRVTGQALKV